MNELLKNRTEAGKLLAKRLEKYKNAPNTIVLALPRGGVPVGYEIAHELNLPLDVFIVRKLGFPGHEEYAMGAIASNDICIFNPDALRGLNIKEEDIQAIVDRETQELKRRNTLYRQNKPMLDLHM
ncbi:MAG: phosphoribosyltransferase, partial [Burkholderiales bacterium]